MTNRMKFPCAADRRSRAVEMMAASALLLTTFASRANADCGTWTQRSPTATPAGGSLRAMAYDSARGVSVLFGGPNGAPNNETWEWNGANWSQKSPAAAPFRRLATAMAYDSARHVTVMFGGSAFDPTTGQYDSDETWEWDGTNWTQRTPTSSPPGRYFHAMAYDSTRGVTVLFGGFQSGSINLNDTWEWDGTNWTQRFPAAMPDERDGHALAYDSIRGVTVLFGGQANNATNDETWEWNGTNWTQRTPAHHPGVRRDHALAYDSVRGVTVFFGGTEPGFVLPDFTWVWDGNDWTLLQPAASPGGRDGLAMTYDSTRHVTVLFGGNNHGDRSDTWELSSTGLPPSIGTQPQPANRCVGQAANFAISATGANLTYQWQISTDGGTTFNNVTTGTDATTPSYTTAVLTAGDNGNKYQCVVSGDCGTRTSNTAALTVNAMTAITTQPGNATAVIQPGSPAPTATFTVVATGVNLSYQWQQSSNNGETFANVSTGTGGNTATYQTAGLIASNTGTRYRCVVTGICGAATSNFATLSVQDASGVSNAVEDGAPNGGDGNSDGIPDRLQDNVTSLPNSSGNYVTLVSPNGTSLGSVVAQGNPSPSDTPAGVQFPAGFLKFEVNNVAVGGTTTVQITLPPGVTANSYWKFGPEPNNTTPHWYEFQFDGATGAVFNGNQIVLTFVDGARGDADLTANGVITDPGAPATKATPAGQTTPTNPLCVNFFLSWLLRLPFPLCGVGCGVAIIGTFAGLVGMKLGRRRRGSRSRRSAMSKP